MTAAGVREQAKAAATAAAEARSSYGQVEERVHDLHAARRQKALAHVAGSARLTNAEVMRWIPEQAALDDELTAAAAAIRKADEAQRVADTALRAAVEDEAAADRQAAEARAAAQAAADEERAKQQAEADRRLGAELAQGPNAVRRLRALEEQAPVTEALALAALAGSRRGGA